MITTNVQIRHNLCTFEAGRRRYQMKGLTFSLIIGFLLASSSVWLISLINDRYTQKEKFISNLLLKRGKKE